MTRSASLQGDFRPEQDLALTALLPEDPAAIETFNVWAYDGAGDIGFNLHPHARDGHFSGAVSLFLPDGRVLRGDVTPGHFSDPAAPGAEQLRLRCVEPFKTWIYELVDLPMLVTSREEQTAGAVPVDRPPTVRASLKVEAVMKAPPWDWGGLLPEMRKATQDKPGLWIANRLTDGPRPGVAYRYDQALSARGEVVVDGSRYEFDGAGLRGHVRGVRIMEGFGTHNWSGGVFPSGMTFGVNAMFRPDGGYFANEGYVFKDGVFHACRVLWATPIDAAASDSDSFVIELACDALGVTRITGRDCAKLWRTLGPTLGYGRDLSAPRLMSQAVARFEHEGEVGYGMDERSCWGAAG
jgi:hypothetical protein